MTGSTARHFVAGSGVGYGIMAWIVPGLDQA
jgi:hypothetical protein